VLGGTRGEEKGKGSPLYCQRRQPKGLLVRALEGGTRKEKIIIFSSIKGASSVGRRRGGREKSVVGQGG